MSDVIEHAPQEYRQWLQTICVGDTVCYRTASNSYATLKVSRVLATCLQFYPDDRMPIPVRAYKDSGKLDFGRKMESTYYLVPYTGEVAARIEECKKRDACYQVVCYADWQGMRTETLQAMTNLILAETEWQRGARAVDANQDAKPVANSD